jgi:hypothetical protein
MKAFELYFNPKSKKNLVFETFCFEPETAREKELGSLYLAGLITGADPNNEGLIGELATLIKTGYYQQADVSAENAFKTILKEANDMLSSITLRDPSFSVNFFALNSKGDELNFSQFGEKINTVFYQNGKLAKAGSGRSAGSASFKNIISGEIKPKDCIIVLSEDIFRFLLEKNILEKIASAENFQKAERVISKFKKETSSLSGFCLILYPEEASSPQKIVPQFGRTNKGLPSIPSIFRPIFKLNFDFLPLSLSKFSLGRAEKADLKNIPAGKPKPINAMILYGRTKEFLERLKSSCKKTPGWLWTQRKNFLSVVLLVLILLAGSFMSQAENKKKLDTALKEINQVEQKMVRADSLLSQKKTQEADILLQEALDQISLKIGKSKTANKEAEQLKSNIEERLFSINKFEKNSQFETLYEFPAGKGNLIPGNMVYQNDNFYLFNQLSGKLSVYNSQEKSYQYFSYPENISFADVFGKDQIIFLDSKNQLVLFRGKEFQDLGPISMPYEETFLESFKIFKNNLYFLSYDSAEKSPQKEIFKYDYLENFKWDGPKIWLDNASKEAVSIGIDGMVWVLNDNNSIKSYYSGLFQNEIRIDIFPRPQAISKILSPSISSYLYLLEPSQKRIIVLDKNGELIKQFQNDQWSGLLDFAVSPDGKTAYLLKSSSILKVPLNYK